MKNQKIKSLLLVPLVFASITTGVVYAEEHPTTSSIQANDSSVVALLVEKLALIVVNFLLN